MTRASQHSNEQSENTSNDREVTGANQGDGDSLLPHPGTTGSKLVYLYLSVVGQATMDELNQKLDMQRLRLYPLLSTMEADGLVHRDGDTFRSLPRTTN